MSSEFNSPEKPASQAPGSTTTAAQPVEATPLEQAQSILTSLRKRIVEGMVEHIVEQRDAFEDQEADDRYHYPLLELEERFLGKLQLIRRAMVELQGLGPPGGGAAPPSSKVHHVRVGPGEPLAQMVLAEVEKLGRALIHDIAIGGDDETGHDVFVVYQPTNRGTNVRKTGKPTS